MAMACNRSSICVGAAWLLFAAAVPCPAKNAAVANAAPAAEGGKAVVRFNLAWEDSWRDATNHDACWVFVKYSADDGATWRHAKLDGSGKNPAGFSADAGVPLEIIIPADRLGAFIQRAGPGRGAVSNAKVELAWDAAADGGIQGKDVRVKVFALELVYVAECPFFAGMNSGQWWGFSKYPNRNEAYLIGSEEAIAVGTNAGNLYYGLDIKRSGDRQGPIPAAFPKGFKAFYLMKTELSQRQYCDFLNTLPALQQGNRHDADLHFQQYRNFIKKTAGTPALFGCDANDNAGPSNAVTDVSRLNEANDGEWVACNWISWMDGAAYLDWACLRPFTELEYEKACRGPLTPVVNEYAWGNTVAEPLCTALIEPHTANERPNRGNATHAGCRPGGPYRCGCYADGSTNRTDAGAGYYGGLDLSGNLWEWAVTVGIPEGRAFTGAHGDGMLSSNGHADVEFWPGWCDGEVTGVAGAGIHGGDVHNGVTSGMISCRMHSAGSAAPRIDRRYAYGCRGVRTAP